MGVDIVDVREMDVPSTPYLIPRSCLSFSLVIGTHDEIIAEVGENCGRPVTTMGLALILDLFLSRYYHVSKSTTGLRLGML